MCILFNGGRIISSVVMFRFATRCTATYLNGYKPTQRQRRVCGITKAYWKNIYATEVLRCRKGALSSPIIQRATKQRWVSTSADYSSIQSSAAATAHNPALGASARAHLHFECGP